MKRFLALILAAAALSGAKRLAPGEELLEKSVAAHGGYSRYQRVETIAYDFVRKSADGATVRGRHYLKLHDGGPVRFREEARGAAGETITVVDSSGVWRLEGGRAVTDPEALRRAGEALASEALWVLAPAVFREGDCAATYIGKGYLNGKLSQRLAIDRGRSPAGRWFTDSERPMTVFFDESARLLDGAQYSPPGTEDAVTVVFSLFADRKGFVVPLQREIIDAEGDRRASFSLTNVAVNDFLDEGLFSPAR